MAIEDYEQLLRVYPSNSAAKKAMIFVKKLQSEPIYSIFPNYPIHSVVKRNKLKDVKVLIEEHGMDPSVAMNQVVSYIIIII